MILAAHLIFSAYGFWLPNDPRGSWSDFVRSWELLRFGRATKVEERHSLARRPHDSALRAAAKKALRYPPVIFSGLQARAIANGFADCVERTECTIYACAIMPDHAHLVVARRHYPIQQLGNLLKGAATTRLRRHNLDPFAPLNGAPQGRAARLPSPWSHKFWKVWLDSPQDITRCIRYVESNPTKSGLKPQRWSLITAYDA
jgi:REP element-mobilizing transposase RayT